MYGLAKQRPPQSMRKAHSVQSWHFRETAFTFPRDNIVPVSLGLRGSMRACTTRGPADRLWAAQPTTAHGSSDESTRGLSANSMRVHLRSGRLKLWGGHFQLLVRNFFHRNLRHETCRLQIKAARPFGTERFSWRQGTCTRTFEFGRVSTTTAFSHLPGPCCSLH